MRIAVIGSGTVDKDISRYIPQGLSELIICGEDTEKIERWARKRRIPKLTLSNDKTAKLSAQKLAKTVAEIADMVVVVGSTLSLEAKLFAQHARKAGKPVSINVRSKGGCRKLD
jgi:4-hydroxy-3-methylbut-2-enyl diphosphate reductase IspH